MCFQRTFIHYSQDNLSYLRQHRREMASIVGSKAWKRAQRVYKYLPNRLNKVRSPILNQSLLIGRVMPGRTPYEKAAAFNPRHLTKGDTSILIRVPYHVYDEYFKAFYQHEWDFVAVEPTGKLELGTGDTVLIKRISKAPKTAESLSLRELGEGLWWEDKTVEKEWWEDVKPEEKPITHTVMEILYSFGDVKDPVTGEMVVAERYRKDSDKSAKLYGETDELEEKFSYNKAPKRGKQEGKRDFTDRKTYKKWHVFKNEDKYGLIN